MLVCPEITVLQLLLVHNKNAYVFFCCDSHAKRAYWVQFSQPTQFIISEKLDVGVNSRAYLRSKLNRVSVNNRFDQSVEARKRFVECLGVLGICTKPSVHL